jgi:hypothetical protein
VLRKPRAACSACPGSSDNSDLCNHDFSKFGRNGTYNKLLANITKRHAFGVLCVLTQVCCGIIWFVAVAAMAPLWDDPVQ